MSSLNILFGTPRANGLLTMQCLAPMAGMVAAQMVACNRGLAFPVLALRSTRRGDATDVSMEPVEQVPVTPPTPARKVPTVVYQSRTISGKAGAVTLAAMPVPQKPVDIQ